MILTLIKTLTATGDASLSFVDGASSVVLDSTYDEYMFVFTDIGPANDGVHFGFQVNATDDAGGGYDTSLMTTTQHRAWQGEASATVEGPEYQTGYDLAQSAARQLLVQDLENDSDSSCAGILHLFSPSSTTYVKHFYSRFNSVTGTATASNDVYITGYINDTTAIDEIRFEMSDGNFDGVIQLYGIA